ncbi:MAG: hypothetical protein JSS21_08410 [Proteobacteria bacterium]|nr:hypothetical protein [Pseudomonadota bacterium]
MTTRAKGPLSGFGWLQRGIGVGFRHPKPIFGGAGFLLLACLVPSLITLPLQFQMRTAGASPNLVIFGGIMVVSMLIGLLIVPLYAGYLQVIDAAERGLPTRARDIFNPYRQGEAVRLIGYGLALIAIYIAVLAVVIAATGGGIARWYMQVLSAQANHQLPPGLPPGFGIAMALLTVFGLFMMGFYSVSLGQIALRRRGVFHAIGDGVMGALKNLLPLIVLAVTLVLAWIVVMIAFAILAVLLALLGKLVGAWLMLLLVIPLYIALLLVVLTVMFGVVYYLWRDVCGGDPASGMAPAIAA